MNDIYLYPHSHSEAVENDELLLWRKSHQANVACKKAIEESIRAGFDGMYLQEGCVQGVLAEYWPATGRYIGSSARRYGIFRRQTNTWSSTRSAAKSACIAD